MVSKSLEMAGSAAGISAWGFGNAPITSLAAVETCWTKSEVQWYKGEKTTLRPLASLISHVEVRGSKLLYPCQAAIHDSQVFPVLAFRIPEHF